MKPAYEEALKKIYNKTPKDNFVAIKFDYGKCVLLPYDDGMKFLSCLKQAELLNEQYGNPKTIVGFDSSAFETKILSRKDYEDIKVSALLGVTIDELNAKEEQLTTT